VDIVGRGRELGAVAGFLDEWTHARALVLEGEPGIGKTTVWSSAVARAREAGHRVLSCRPAPTEASLPFASLGDLLEPAIDEAIGRLPPPQRLALEAALARVEPTGDFGRLAVSRATAAVVRELAREPRLLIAIDDAQWLDAATAAVLEFALRREPVRVLVAQRSGDGQIGARIVSGLPSERLSIGPLSLEELARLVADRADLALPRPRLAELHRISAGNPYFALEIVRALRMSPDGPLPIPRDVAAVLRDRIAGLSAAALEVLLLAAASPHPTFDLLATVSGSSAGVGEATAAGILERDGERLRFSHPLLASVVYGDAGASARRAAHSHLAAAATDPEDRAVHLARAVDEPDAGVADELDAAANRAHKRGAPAIAAELEQRAIDLTPADLDDLLLQRAARTAEYHLAAGDTERGRKLLEELFELRPAGHERARIALRLGNARYVMGDVQAAHALFGEALAHAGTDSRLRAEAEQALAFTAMLGGDVPNALRHARTSLALAEQLGDPTILPLALGRVALCEFLAGQGLDHELFRRAVELEGYVDYAPIEQLPSYAYAGVALMADELALARTLYEALLAAAEEHGDERAVPSAMFAASELEWRCGNWQRALELATDAVARSRQAGLGTVRAWSLNAQARVQAHIGEVDAARAAAGEGLQVAEAAGAIAALTHLTWTLGFADLSLGDFEAAHDLLGPLSQVIAAVGLAEPGVVRFTPDAIEALIGLGRFGEAEGLLGSLEESALALDRISARAAAARCRAMLSAASGELESARASLAEALVQHQRLEEPFELARTLLARGTIERRANRRAAAREALTGALELFDSLGAALWAERTASELARIPGRVPRSSELSEAERRVVDLAVQGLSNKQIASRLFIAVRTVEAHLSSAYAKLGVRSRAQLAARVQKTVDIHN
jgi:DNA-binding CsgD family transcriptional regulator